MTPAHSHCEYSTSKAVVTYKLLVVLLVTLECNCSLEHDRLYRDIFVGYSNQTFPTLNTTSVIHISVSFQISSLNNFEQLSGRLGMSFLFQLHWKEERISWNSSEYGGIESLLVDPRTVWRPQLYVLQPADKLRPIGHSSTLLRIHSNGFVSWSPAEVIELTCFLNVAYFPFDTQRCLMTLAGWEYHPDELLVHAASPYLEREYFTGHSQWELLESPFANGTLGHDDYGPSCVNLTLVLRRKSEFFVVYIIVPITFLGMMNNFVFLIPASSGERSSVAITTFLSFVVYLGIIDDIVPESSAPIALIYYYVLFLMLYSSTIMFLCIISQRIHDREGDVPFFIKCLICRCLPIRTRKSKRDQTTDQFMNYLRGVDSNTLIHKTNVDKKIPRIVTWKIVGKAFDKVCFIIILLSFVSFTFLCYYEGYSHAWYARIGDSPDNWITNIF